MDAFKIFEELLEEKEERIANAIQQMREYNEENKNHFKKYDIINTLGEYSYKDKKMTLKHNKNKVYFVVEKRNFEKLDLAMKYFLVKYLL
jgi:hypothetical protein